MARIRLEVDLDASQEDLDVLEGAVGPEHEEEIPGARTRLERIQPGTLRLNILGDELPPVRAAANAYLRWARTVEDVLEIGPAGSNRGASDGR